MRRSHSSSLLKEMSHPDGWFPYLTRLKPTCEKCSTEKQKKTPPFELLETYFRNFRCRCFQKSSVRLCLPHESTAVLQDGEPSLWQRRHIFSKSQSVTGNVPSHERCRRAVRDQHMFYFWYWRKKQRGNSWSQSHSWVSERVFVPLSELRKVTELIYFFTTMQMRSSARRHSAPGEINNLSACVSWTGWLNIHGRGPNLSTGESLRLYFYEFTFVLSACFVLFFFKSGGWIAFAQTAAVKWN